MTDERSTGARSAERTLRRIGPERLAGRFPAAGAANADESPGGRHVRKARDLAGGKAVPVLTGRDSDPAAAQTAGAQSPGPSVTASPARTGTSVRCSGVARAPDGPGAGIM